MEINSFIYPQSQLKGEGGCVVDPDPVGSGPFWSDLDPDHAI
jgi:hypothetical protein